MVRAVEEGAIDELCGMMMSSVCGQLLVTSWVNQLWNPEAIFTKFESYFLPWLVLSVKQCRLCIDRCAVFCPCVPQVEGITCRECLQWADVDLGLRYRFWGNFTFMANTPQLRLTWTASNISYFVVIRDVLEPILNPNFKLKRGKKDVMATQCAIKYARVKSRYWWYLPVLHQSQED